jgi:phage gp36-like protein
MSGYCTNDDVKHYLPLCALPSLTNDGDPTAISIDDTVINFARTSATADIDSYLVNIYDLTVTHAVKPDFLMHCEAIFICVWICRHAANGTIPPGLQTFYDEKMKNLQSISEGKRQIPGIAPRSDPGVSMSNITHDQRFGPNKLRTAPLTNTGDQNSVVPRNTDYIQLSY